MGGGGGGGGAALCLCNVMTPDLGRLTLMCLGNCGCHFCYMLGGALTTKFTVNFFHPSMHLFFFFNLDYIHQ